MRHQMALKKLGRTSSHRNAMFRNQITSMIQSERIVTTLVKARELRPLVERMVTLAKEDTVHNRRLAARTIADSEMVSKLFDKVSPRFTERPGGYTRIIKLGPRRGDGAEMAILEFVDYKLADAAPKTPAKAGKKKAAAEPAKETETEEKKEAAPAKKKAPAKKAAAKEGGEKPKAAKKASSKKKKAE